MGSYKQSTKTTTQASRTHIEKKKKGNQQRFMIFSCTLLFALLFSGRCASRALLSVGPVFTKDLSAFYIMQTTSSCSTTFQCIFDECVCNVFFSLAALLLRPPFQRHAYTWTMMIAKKKLNVQTIIDIVEFPDSWSLNVLHRAQCIATLILTNENGFV